ncbi:protein phosphatase 1B isoform X4 [Gadus morhua]|uniref:protein phosphatase 1B isoform X3 n=1 Tax=Gadus morhua TaxID=8049 RepID=UPI0011B71A75|nr:protein phosphatase 1B isoform X3 [Gadus morhua]XP_030234877.1 protein phosphatase 1B isoform X4 [Gadus morhua]XP_059928594.1 protein phosphatase 1B isoform X2 [Gadus macrocephalus]XP_059928595.1 protein phosphatase 1B isoform X3 [Gadus macrocephalus]
MGAFLDKPKTEKHNAHGEGNGLRYGLSSMQGWRVEMEDAHNAMPGLPAQGMADWAFFAVYDGHAGSRVAHYCSKHLLEHIFSAGSGLLGTDNDSDDSTADPISPVCLTVEAVKTGIRSGFLHIDEHMRSCNGMDRSGSTAVGVLLSPDHLFFINCGDSRAVLYRNARVCFSTLDHKPCNPQEKERIQNAGGSVMIQRVNGSLAVSRALGDFDYKCVDGKGQTEQLVSPEPDVFEMVRSPELDQFVVLACDGIWDVMSNEELCEFVRSRLEVSHDLERVCNELVDTCLHKGSRDNMSVVLVCFPNAPQISEEAVRKDADLNKHLESRVEEMLSGSGEEAIPDLVTVMRNLSAANIPNLPPGGGLASKRSLIEAVYQDLNPPGEEDGPSCFI